jgi:hypothetical protein
MGNRETDSFPARIELDSRSALAIVDFDWKIGLVHHVGMRGRAGILPFDRERAKRLLHRSLGTQEDQWDAQRFIGPLDDPGQRLHPVRAGDGRRPRPVILAEHLSLVPKWKDTGAG